jgi:ParB family chromosome partitioning protein
MIIELRTIPLEQIHPNPFQPRESFEKESLQELADSIKDTNVIQPIIVRRHREGYQIIAGERRWRAAQMTDLKEIPCIIKDIAEERVLLESLVENLHRKDLTDIERENAIHELWTNRKTLGFETKAELARTIGISEGRIQDDVDAWEFRHKEGAHGLPSISTRAIRGTQGLPVGERRSIIEKVATGEIKVSEVDIVAKVMRRASEPIKRELLKPKSFVSPKIAETIVEKLPSEEEQNIVLEETKKLRLTEDEVEDRVREIQRAREMGKPLMKEMGVREGITYLVGEYECPHCKRHYLIKCDGKRDWVE